MRAGLRFLCVRARPGAGPQPRAAGFLPARAIRAFAGMIGIATTVALAACSSNPLATTGAGSGAVEPLPASPSGRVSGAPLPPAQGGPAPPPVPMGGRWTLASTAGGACGMNFGAGAGAAEGTIAPEGGCPGNFFTSRKWTFEQTGLVIRDHTGKPLARLASAGPDRFEGRNAEGTAQVTLSR